MATITGLTKDRMVQIEAASVVDGTVDGNGSLILTRHDGTTINAGSVIGPKGDAGVNAAPGSVTPTANTTPIRTADGRVKTAPPTEVDDSATKKYVDDAAAPLAAKSYVDQSDLMNRKLARAQFVISGGGTRKVDANGISWSQRFVVMGLGRVPASTPSGFLDIAMPPDGTVIPLIGNGSSTTVTVASGQIPMGAWRALYYDLPFGSTNASDPSRFKLVDYLADSTDIPSTWVLVAVKNNDSRCPAYKWGDGREQDYWKTMTLQNSWVAYGASWNAPAYRILNDGRVQLRGLMKNGTQQTAAMTFSADLSPEGTSSTGLMFTQFSNTGIARVDVHGDGTVQVVAYASGGSNAFVSLDNISWFPSGS